MRKLIFYLNLILTVIAFVIMMLGFIDHDRDAGILALLVLGFYQVVTAIVLTIYLAVNNRKLFLGFVVYWLLVLLFFNFLIRYAVQYSFFIALYHLYLCYALKSNPEL